MNDLKLILILSLISLSIISCREDDSCAIDNECLETPGTNSQLCNYSVVTKHPSERGQYVATIYDTRNSNVAIDGHVWEPGQLRGPNWRQEEIGTIFGIAIDRDDKIYFAASDIYFYHSKINGQSFVSYSSNGGINKHPMQIWVADMDDGGEARQLVELPVASSERNPFIGIGNIAYDKLNHQLFATNLDDGKIYRVDLASGAVVDSYDPWTTTQPRIYSSLNTDEIPFGIGVNIENRKVKVYFSRNDFNNNLPKQVYSITLNDDGSFNQDEKAILELSYTNENKNEITDIAFSADHNKMLISERGIPWSSETKSYVNNGFTGWQLFYDYYVGGRVSIYNPKNSAGGIDFASTQDGQGVLTGCDDLIWASGNNMATIELEYRYPSYGIQGIAFSGNQPAHQQTPPLGNAYTDIFIDFDGVFNRVDRGLIGDVEVFDCNSCIIGCE